jgi:hypothetical protein
MKKYFILAITFATLCILTLTLGLIFLDPKTTTLIWIFSTITMLSCNSCFIAYHLTKKQKRTCKNCSKCVAITKDNYIRCSEFGGTYQPKYCAHFTEFNPPENKIEKIKEKLIELQKEPYKGTNSFVQLNQHKGKIEGFSIALKIFEDYLNKNQQ